MYFCRLSGLENELLGLNSRVNAVLWSRSSPEIENIDVICFGHLLFEMCAGYELASPTPSKAHLEVDLERYPQVNLGQSIDTDCANIDLLALSPRSVA
jgi:PX domain-containing protein kinase-like protein